MVMAVRIRREEKYIPLPVSMKHILAMKGKENYSVPLEDVCMSQEAFMSNEELPIALLGLANGITLKCLVVQLGDEKSCGAEDVWTNCARYCADCRMCEMDAMKQFKLSRIENVNFRLRWKHGKFYPVGDKK